MTAELTRRSGRDTEEKSRASRGAPSARQAAFDVREEPRVDLLPPEVKASRRNDAIARRLVLALGVVILLVIGGILGSTVLAAQASAGLAAAQGETQSLVLQQQKYAKVRAVQTQIALTQAAQQVGASTEIDWAPFLGRVKGTLGSGLSLTGVTIDSASPLAAYQQSSVPLQGPRVATVTIDVTATRFGDVAPWLTRLGTLPAVTDVMPGATTLDASGYTASAIIHVDESAFDQRFAAKGK
jgi:hypothetical protein